MGTAGVAEAGRPTDAGAAARRYEDQIGFVLHSYPYSESSLIVETFTREHGRVPLLAKGVKRQGSALRGVLLQFQRIGLSWSGKGDLRNLTRAEWLGGIPALSGKALACGFYLNELLLKLLARGDPHERLFDSYAAALAALGASARAADILRIFEKALLREIGYAVDLTVEAGSGVPVDPAADYGYVPERGLRRLATHEPAELALPGWVALAIARDDYGNAQVAAAAKQLMRMLLDHQLNGRRLATRQIFSLQPMS
ncbi:MAG: DNA repair protein RecO [Burkholderiales bacterium]|nr:DNA repair protein RecO [Burkholderiales bacterium]